VSIVMQMLLGALLLLLLLLLGMAIMLAGRLCCRLGSARLAGQIAQGAAAQQPSSSSSSNASAGLLLLLLQQRLPQGRSMLQAQHSAMQQQAVLAMVRLHGVLQLAAAAVVACLSRPRQLQLLRVPQQHPL
jgi:hypothetical protein